MITHAEIGLAAGQTELPVPLPALYEYTHADGTVFQAESKQQVALLCPVIARLAIEAPDTVDIVLETSATGVRTIEQLDSDTDLLTSLQSLFAAPLPKTAAPKKPVEAVKIDIVETDIPVQLVGQVVPTAALAPAARIEHTLPPHAVVTEPSTAEPVQKKSIKIAPVSDEVAQHQQLLPRPEFPAVEVMQKQMLVELIGAPASKPVETATDNARVVEPAVVIKVVKKRKIDIVLTVASQPEAARLQAIVLGIDHTPDFHPTTTVKEPETAIKTERVAQPIDEVVFVITEPVLGAVESAGDTNPLAVKIETEAESIALPGDMTVAEIVLEPIIQMATPEAVDVIDNTEPTRNFESFVTALAVLVEPKLLDTKTGDVQEFSDSIEIDAPATPTALFVSAESESESESENLEPPIPALVLEVSRSLTAFTSQDTITEATHGTLLPLVSEITHLTHLLQLEEAGSTIVESDPEKPFESERINDVAAIKNKLEATCAELCDQLGIDYSPEALQELADFFIGVKLPLNTQIETGQSNITLVTSATPIADLEHLGTREAKRFRKLFASLVQTRPHVGSLLGSIALLCSELQPVQLSNAL